ncbi:MAG TPA: hypothetical protein VIX19_12610 [Terriglobales bacterium]
MTKSPALALHTSLFLIFFVLGIAGCGSMMSGSRQMQSLTVTPASADAQSFPGGKVQFTAMGTFNMAPISVMSPPVLWTIGSPFGSPPVNMPAASVDANGLAQCNGFVGNVIVEATAPTEPEIPLLQMTSMTITVSGMAQMICP